MRKQPECEGRSGHPWRRRYNWEADRRTVRVRFFRRLAALAFLLFLLGVCGMVALAWVVASALGLFSPSSHGGAITVLGGGFMAAAIAVILLVGTIRRVGTPLRNLMEAADRVADGDYSVRVAEHGPPPIRGPARALLRTPLTIIQGKLEELLDGVYPCEEAQLTEILDEANQLSRLIEDLRTLALSETGALRLEKEPTDVSELARDVIRAFATEASVQQVTLKIEVPDDLPPVMIDAVRIRQVSGKC